MYNETEFKRALALKETHPHFKIAFGWFPQDAKDITEKHIQILQKAIDSNQIDCLGEIGLDYYWDKSFINEQKELLSNKFKWPITPIFLYPSICEKQLKTAWIS